MKPIILIGMKACGKSTIGNTLAKKLNLPFIELDHEIEILHKDFKKENLSCRQIVNKYQQDYFRNMENLALKKISLTRINSSFILACGGGTPINPQNRKILKRLGTILYLKTDKSLILGRIKTEGKPSFFPKDKSLEEGLYLLLLERTEIYEKIADIIININNNDLNKTNSKIIKAISKI
jgi:shikimate kinase